MKLLWTEMAVDEVALSIAANGFFPEENLFAIPRNPNEKDEKKKKYIVVEGNRRLAAVRLLCEDALRQTIRATDLPRISPSEKKALDELPVSVYETRKELWEYFGFRHINGPKPWDSFSKAKYIAYVKQNYKVSLDTIAERIGDKHATVKKLYRGYVILLQAEAQARFNREDRIRNKFYFSHLYTAADQKGYQDFLGITPENSLKANPVPRNKLKELRELMVWIYGSKEENKSPVVSTQHPDLTNLRVVLTNKTALAALRAGYPLDRAVEIARGDKLRFREAITKAKENLIEANGSISLGYSGEPDLFELGKEILILSQKILESMESMSKRVKR
ncbi:MAG: hypothetical protein AABO41_26355 [Acidobacteriota bacterium]